MHSQRTSRACKRQRCGWLLAVAIVVIGLHPLPLLAQAIPTAEQRPAAASEDLSPRPALSDAASPPALTPQGSANRANSDHGAGGIKSALTVGCSLAVVLAVFLVIVWGLRRALPQGLGILPPEAFEVLGRAPLANRQQAQLIHCGNKVLLVSVHVAGTETLTEITDPTEVDRLVALCRRARPNGSALGQVLRRREKPNA
jgi:flagellar biogenesis protein FliO